MLQGKIISNISLIEKINSLQPTWLMWILTILLFILLAIMITLFSIVCITLFFPKRKFPKLLKIGRILIAIFFIGTVIGCIFGVFYLLGILIGTILFIWITSATSAVYYLISPLIATPREPIEWKKFMIWGTIAVISITVTALLTIHHLM